VQAIRDVGYGVDTERAELEVVGIVCAPCVMAIETALKEIPGVIDESVNAVTAKAVIDYDPSIVTVDKLIQTIRNTGVMLRKSRKPRKPHGLTGKGVVASIKLSKRMMTTIR